MKRVALLIRQVEFIQLRMEAMETILAEVAKPMFEKDPEWLKKKMDAKHLELLKKMDEADKAMAQKAHEEAMKPKLVMVNG